jgi:AcrR family transcriptional regulator
LVEALWQDREAHGRRFDLFDTLRCRKFGEERAMGRHREFDIEEALDAALSVFWRKGYDGTSYDDLTQATGVTRPSLYSAFGNKQALFKQASARYFERYLGFMTDALSEPTSRRVVERILRETAELSTRYPSHPGCFGINGAIACSDEAEPIRQCLIESRAAAEKALGKRLEQSRVDGDLPVTVDSEALATFVFTVTQGIAVQAKAGARREALDAVVDQALMAWPT